MRTCGPAGPAAQRDDARQLPDRGEAASCGYDVIAEPPEPLVVHGVGSGQARRARASARRRRTRPRRSPTGATPLSSGRTRENTSSRRAAAPRRTCRATELGGHAVAADLVELVEGDERVAVQVGRGTPRLSSKPVSNWRWFSRMVNRSKPRVTQRLAGRGAQFGLDHGRGGADGVDVALVELAEPARAAAGRPATRAGSGSA